MTTTIAEQLGRLQRSPFRRRFHLNGSMRDYAVQKGLPKIRKHAQAIIHSRLAPANPVNDGKQIPMKNHPVFIAQHATATCCRNCLKKWHGMPKNQPLSPEQEAFILELLMAWILGQLDVPGLPDSTGPLAGQDTPTQRELF